MHEIWVMHRIAERLNCSDEWVFEDPWSALKTATSEAFDDGSLDDLFKGKVLKLRQRPRMEYQTPSGKIDFFSSMARERGADPLPFQPSLEDDEGWFTLLNSALPKWTHSQFRDVYGPIPAIVWMNPVDAHKNGIKNGDEVVLYNHLGSLTVDVAITGKISEGVLWSPRPLTGNNGAPLNCLAANDPQQVGAGPRFNSIKVKIRSSLGNTIV
jgi:anaerobic selenocysteine-containing dehydrogenase